MIETGFGKEFSEPPSVSVSDARTHCEACKEPLHPSVMHKCHGNKEYEPPVISSTEITEPCPDCKGRNASVLTCLWSGGKANTCVVVCRDCRTFLWGEVDLREKAIYGWNLQASVGISSIWPKWRAALPGDDERNNVIPSESKPAHPNLIGYKGACPAMHVEGEVCDLCEGTGTIPPTKADAQ